MAIVIFGCVGGSAEKTLRRGVLISPNPREPHRRAVAERWISISACVAEVSLPSRSPQRKRTRSAKSTVAPGGIRSVPLVARVEK